MATSKPKSWREILPIHPAADLFPMMTPGELKALGEDIRKQGQRVAIAVWKAQRHSRPVLLDGRNRLDAMEAVGIVIRVDYEGTDLNPSVRLFKHMPPDGPWWPIEIAELSGIDPYDVVLSANIHRRHLTAEQKRDLIAKVLKARPEKSDRQIADEIKSNRNTVGRIRADMEKTGDVSRSDTRTDTKGRRQQARKPAPQNKAGNAHLKPEPAAPPPAPVPPAKPDSWSDCGIDPDNPADDLAEAGDTPEMIWRRVFLFRTEEAVRSTKGILATIGNAEIDEEVTSACMAAAQAWLDLFAKLSKNVPARVEHATPSANEVPPPIATDTGTIVPVSVEDPDPLAIPGFLDRRVAK